MPSDEEETSKDLDELLGSQDDPQSSGVSEENGEGGDTQDRQSPSSKETPESSDSSSDMEVEQTSEEEVQGGDDEGQSLDEGDVSKEQKFFAIENELGEKITVSTDAYNYIQHLKNEIESRDKEIDRLQTQVQRLNSKTSIGNR